MSSWFTRSFGYGLGAAAGRAIFSEDQGEDRKKSSEPVRQKTEEEILADEKRFDEEAKQYEAEDRKRG